MLFDTDFFGMLLRRVGLHEGPRIYVLGLRRKCFVRALETNDALA